MSRPQLRQRRQTVFMKAAERRYEQLEEWSDKHRQASFGESEAEARKRRRELMGKTLEQLVNGRGSGLQVEAPQCQGCGGKMEFEGYCQWGMPGLEGDSGLERA